jgi:hypothetical protein
MLVPIALALFASAVVMTTSTFAQTQGMERRDDRRDNRQGARNEKHACKAGDNSRAECRQHKRDTKQEGRPVNKPAGQ